MIKSILLPLQHMLCPPFCSRWRYVKTLQVPLPSFSGVQTHKREESIGQSGKKVCLPREKDGIGFRMIPEFNLVLLVKQL